MKVLLVQVGHRPIVIEIDNSLKAMQAVVDGYIEVVHLDGSAVLICNEEGKINGMPLNRMLFDNSGQLVDIIAGDFFICDAPSDSEGFEDITDGQIEFFTRYFEI